LPFTFDDFEYPDVISYLQNETNLTRRTLAQILIDSGRIDDFKKNPQMFIDGAVAIIKNVMSKFVVDGIKYHKLGDDEIWAQELFESEELSGYLNSNMVETPNHGIYEYTVYDSDIERDFAERLDANEDVKVFAKLPDWFKIPTPLGTYNPDWAILVEKDGCNRLYFVVETKGTDCSDSYRRRNRRKSNVEKPISRHSARIRLHSMHRWPPTTASMIWSIGKFKTVINNLLE
jgi:Restriction endonuclease